MLNKKLSTCPGHMGQLVEASTHTPKWWRLYSWSGHIPRLQVQSPARACTGVNKSLFVSHRDVSLFLKLIKRIFRSGFKKLSTQFLFCKSWWRKLNVHKTFLTLITYHGHSCNVADHRPRANGNKSAEHLRGSEWLAHKKTDHRQNIDNLFTDINGLFQLNFPF